MKFNLSFAPILLLFAFKALGAQQLTVKPADDSLTQARALLQAGDLAKANATLTSYLAEHIDSAEAHFLLGYTLFLQQKPTQSLEQYTAGARNQRPSPEDLKIVSFDYVLLGDYTDADKWLSAVVAETPQDAHAWYLLGRAKYNENKFADAINCFNHTLLLNPHDVKSENNLGLSYEGLNRIEDARKAYMAAIQWQQDASAKSGQPYLNLGVLLTEQGHPEQALPYLQQATTLEPANPKTHEQLGRAYQTLQMLPQAEKELKEAVGLAPDVSALHFRLGQIYQHLGLKPEAQNEFALCSKLNSTHSSIDTPNPAQPDTVPAK
ncbi:MULTISPECIES: lipopolysaccharide assembly protein LapB [Acidobacteriaceae]|uniref:tetratricopeptide repeat protein n=1 Tax=Acidobacteriaceae TaxID=204434 RepID=UPI00131C9A80|nr:MULTISPECIES: tetratricopeptide repeat protein [Acidobacteriaceae]MDW5264701.1 tetratricopeptide repeat protein [Edaphobacter sp.]